MTGPDTSKLLSLDDAFRRQGSALPARLGRPSVRGIYLPAPVADETFRDAFGFVFLDDGSVGPFYVSMDRILPGLWRRIPDPAAFGADPETLLQGFSVGDPIDRALAVGTYNALSAALLRRCAFVPPARPRRPVAAASTHGAPVGMVGWFAPLIDRLRRQGSEVWVLEKAPQRVELQPGVRLCGDAVQLRRCGHVLCTAATLVNGSLAGLLDAIGGQTPLELIGPSASGLPDPLFAHGVSAVGGVSFDDRGLLLEQLAAGRPWGDAGRKYRLDHTSYPGLSALVARLADAGVDTDRA